MTSPDDRVVFTISLYEDRNTVSPLDQFGLPLLHVETARDLMFTWARERRGSFLRLVASFANDPVEEWERSDGLWQPMLLPSLEIDRAKASR